MKRIFDYIGQVFRTPQPEDIRDALKRTGTAIPYSELIEHPGIPEGLKAKIQDGEYTVGVVGFRSEFVPKIIDGQRVGTRIRIKGDIVTQWTAYEKEKHWNTTGIYKPDNPEIHPIDLIL